MKKSSYENLIAAISDHAMQKGSDTAFTFNVDPPCSYQRLQLRLTQIAGMLIAKNLRFKDRVIIAIPNSTEFFFAFFGVIKAGGVAVPISPASNEARIGKLAELCDASYLLTSEKHLVKLGKLNSQQHQKPVRCLKVEDSTNIDSHFDYPDIQADEIAMMQFTSGSTGDPKCVQITHKGLMTNMIQMIEGMEISDNDTFVSCLPVYHDMGLILMTMVPILLGRPFYLLPTGIRYLNAWLKTIETKKGTFTAAPDFMYRFALKFIKEPDKIDLSTLRTALNAAEPVRSKTIEDFEALFNLKNILLPAYGLAEATVGVSCWKPGSSIKADEKGHVCVGKPFAGIDVKIDYEESNSNYGEILVKSPANSLGYFRNPEATNDLFTQEGYIRTGDYGYLDKEGDLTIVGRKKNVIVQGGLSVASKEVEELVDNLPHVRRSAAIGLDRGRIEGEQIAIFAESKRHRPNNSDDKALIERKIEIVDAFYSYFGFRPGKVFVLPPKSIPMTANGKIQYGKLLESFRSGAFGDESLN